MLEPGEPPLQARDEPHADQQRNHQPVAARDQHIVHEDLEKRRQGESGKDQRQRRQDDVEERGARVAEPGEETAERARRPAAGTKLGTWLEEEADVGVLGVEVVPGEGARPFGRVVDVDPVAPEPLQHHEVAEVPVHDHREAVLGETLEAGLQAPGDHAQRLRRPRDVERLGAVARHAAAHPQLFEGDPPAVVGEDHRQTGGAALGPLHLQHGGHRPAAPAPGVQIGLHRLCAPRRRLLRRRSVTAGDQAHRSPGRLERRRSLQSSRICEGVSQTTGFHRQREIAGQFRWERGSRLRAACRFPDLTLLRGMDQVGSSGGRFRARSAPPEPRHGDAVPASGTRRFPDAARATTGACTAGSGKDLRPRLARERGPRPRRGGR